MNISLFKNFLEKNSNNITREEIERISSWEYNKFFLSIWKRYEIEKDKKIKKQIEFIISEMIKYVKEIKANWYKFSYEKCQNIEHYKYWFEYYLQENNITKLLKIIQDIQKKFPEEKKIIEKIVNKYNKAKKEYDKNIYEIQEIVYKENELKKIERLLMLDKNSEAMSLALELINKFPSDNKIKKYISKIDMKKHEDISVSEIESISKNSNIRDIIDRKIKDDKKNEKELIKEIIAKVNQSYKKWEYSEWLDLIKQSERQYEIKNKKLQKLYKKLLKAKTNKERNKQKKDYKIEINSLKLLQKNWQYKDALMKANSILKKYYLIDKKEVISYIAKIKDNIKNEQIHKKQNRIAEWIEEVNMKMAQINKKSLLVFYEKMSWFLKAKIDIKTALQIIMNQTKDSWIKYFTKRLLVWLDSWMKMSDVLKWEKAISKFDLSMIRIWEKTWQLWDMFWKIYKAHQENSKRNKQIKSIMIYPAIVIVLTLSIFIWLLIFIIPQFVWFFDKAWVDLPWITKFMISSSNFIQNQWLLLIIIIILSIIAMIMFWKTNLWSYTYWYILLKTPVVWDIIKKKYSVNFCKNLSLLLKSGLPILECIDLIIQWSSNPYYADEYSRIKFEVESWVTFSRAVWLWNMSVASKYSNQFIPLEIAYTIDIWEKTWQISSMLENVWEIYDDDLKLYISNLQSLLEPAIIVVVWWMIFIFVLSIFLPMLWMYSLVWK